MRRQHQAPYVSAVCFVHTCRRLIDLSNDCRCAARRRRHQSAQAFRHRRDPRCRRRRCETLRCDFSLFFTGFPSFYHGFHHCFPIILSLFPSFSIIFSSQEGPTGTPASASVAAWVAEKTMNFASEMTDCASKTMNFVFKMMNFLFKMMNFVFKMMNFGRVRMFQERGLRALGLNRFSTAPLVRSL